MFGISLASLFFSPDYGRAPLLHPFYVSLPSCCNLCKSILHLWASPLCPLNVYQPPPGGWNVFYVTAPVSRPTSFFPASMHNYVSYVHLLLLFPQLFLPCSLPHSLLASASYAASPANLGPPKIASALSTRSLFMFAPTLLLKWMPSLSKVSTYPSLWTSLLISTTAKLSWFPILQIYLSAAATALSV